ncbi:secretory lipase-domain-containing protein [Chlamydoabsidia padenii]|nr:secretory lipase-domain-containing protein [Chlamydoabsidia padenii]
MACVYITCIHAVPHTKDDFLAPPIGFENQKPGAILRLRPLPRNSLAAFSPIPHNLKNVYQILYRTTNDLGQPDSTLTTLLVPFNANTSRLLSYQAMIDTPSLDCMPSRALRTGYGLKGFLTQAELLFIDTLLDRGWYVSTPDYEGSRAAFGCGVIAGQALLDSIRAVLASTTQTKIDPQAETQLWGYSGGALATGWAVQLHYSYAPELKIVGAAMGGTPVNLNATLNSVNRTPYAGIAISGIIGLTHANPDLAAYIDTILRPDKKEAFYKAKELCLTGLLLHHAFDNIDSYIALHDYRNAPIARKALEDNVMGRRDTPTIPLYMYHARYDLAVPFAPAVDLYTHWCEKGARIQFVEDTLSGHGVLFVTGTANAIIYLQDRFNGVPLRDGCSSRRTISSLMDPGARAVFGKMLWDDLKALLGLALGPR